MTLQDYCKIGLEIIEEVVSEGLFLNEDVSIIHNLDHDIKISLDLILSEKLSSKLKIKTNLNVLSEEDSSFDNTDDEFFWIIDPLDGSLNYLKGFPFYAISIALVKNKKPISVTRINARMYFFILMITNLLAFYF